MAFQTTAIVVRNRKVRPLYYALEMDCPLVAETIQPGQFVMLRVSKALSPLLRRPFSICKSYPTHPPQSTKRGHIVILYKKVGKGTERMTGWRKGEEVDLIGPLGNGFTLPPSLASSHVILIGGGVGIASLYPLAKVVKSRQLSILVGGRTGEDILWPYDSGRLKQDLLIATEDGSLGFKGTVIDLFLTLRTDPDREENRYLYACGPMEMLKRLSDLTRSKGLTAQASLEARMACGFGACWGCVIKTKDPSAPYQRVCKDGPVFDLKEILWEE
jgi:dihydroorotate dehydrogenase electron transfer subunit